MKIILYIWATLLAICLGLTANHALAEPIVTESTSKSETTVKSPPPSAISPNITTINNKNCSTGVSGAVQTQILGISMGGTTRDLNCELVVLSESLYFQQMKAPATTLLCQNHKVWWAMWDAGVYCPIEGKFGISAKEYYESNTGLMPKRPKVE
jgi:hypothetical protein